MSSREPKAHLLVVDDTPDNAHLLSQLLQHNGFRTSIANSGMQALELVAQQPPDMILLDVMMPVMDGYEVTRRIRADASLPFIPIILVTAKTAMPDKLEGLESGADDFLTKPVNRLELLARVRALLRLKRAQDDLRAEQHKTNLLYRLGRQLNSSLDLDQVLPLALEQTMHAFGASYGQLVMIDEHGNLWREIAVPDQPDPPGYQRPEMRTAIEQGFASLDLDQPEPQIIDDLHGSPSADNTPGLVHSAVTVGLKYKQHKLGILALFHERPGGFHNGQRDLMASIADAVSMALYNAWLYTRLRDAENSREQMLGMLAHDMRTPLAGVISCLELLERSEPDEIFDPELITMALDACRYQDAMIGDLLDLHRAESGQLILERTSVDLGILAEGIIPQVQIRAQQKNITLSSHIAPGLMLDADPDKVGRVIGNLLRNAIKYTPYEGLISLHATLDVAIDMVHVVVEDTGYNISEESINKIFDRFFQAPHSARRSVGVGFAFCREMVQMHGGRIWAENKPDRSGTCVHFTMPLVANQKEPIHEQMADLDSGRRPASVA